MSLVSPSQLLPLGDDRYLFQEPACVEKYYAKFCKAVFFSRHRLAKQLHEKNTQAVHRKKNP